jgi:L-lactate dehydrogenase complex protein LldG
MVASPRMSEPAAILDQIRAALAHQGLAVGPPAAVAGTATGDVRRCLPAVGANLQENLALFRQHAVELKVDFQLIPEEMELGDRLRQLAAAEGWRRVASHRGAQTDAACRALALPVCLVDDAHDVAELEQCDAGITECDALVAQTGTVLVTSRSAGGRALSVLPPHHVVLARSDQLLPGLPEAFALLKSKYAPNYPSLISFITGPSRTGDIERILVLGAHGPKKLTIFCR